MITNLDVARAQLEYRLGDPAPRRNRLHTHQLRRARSSAPRRPVLSWQVRS